MTVTIDKSLLGLSEDDWEQITDVADTWNDDFTTDGMDNAKVTALLGVVTTLSTTHTGNTALADLVRQLNQELITRATPGTVPPPVTGTTTTTTTTTTPTTDTAADSDPPVMDGGPEPPQEGPPPLSTVPPGLPVVASAYYEQPAAHKKVVPFLGGKIPLRNKNLVDLAVKAYYGVNREDVVAEISQKYQEVTGTEYTEPAGAEAIKQSRRPGYKDTDAVISGTGGYPAHWPAVPDGDVPVHKESIKAFLDFGEAGQPFTGIVRFGGRSQAGAPTDPKIILFPTQASGDYEEVGVRTHPDEDDPDGILQSAKVYGKKPGEYTTHVGPGSQSSHGKLSSLIEDKEKYKALALEGQTYQASGLTIGFTVIKGGTSTAHKFSFVSRSSNNPTFALLSPTEEQDLAGSPTLNRLLEQRKEQYKSLQVEGDGSLTKEWAAKIISSVENALAATT